MSIEVGVGSAPRGDGADQDRGAEGDSPKEMTIEGPRLIALSRFSQCVRVSDFPVSLKPVARRPPRASDCVNPRCLSRYPKGIERASFEAKRMAIT
jgi:hypothetical protein